MPGLTRRDVLGGLAGMASAAASRAAPGVRLQVGPSREIKTIAEAARQAREGDRIEVDAGDYVGDVSVWTRPDIEMRAVGGRVRLRAGGAAAEGKAIWVVRADRMSVDGFDFEGARVPHRNGAGIRFERGSLAVRDCSFMRNESGILAGNDAGAVLSVEDCEFGFNGHGDGQSHNLYAGRIAELRVTGSYFHHAEVGHLLKSRAARSLITYNRLTDEADGRASYELEFPDGGDALVLGNLIGKGPRAENSVLISYGAEGRAWPNNRMRLIHNTLVNRLGDGVLLRVLGPALQGLVATDNLLVGRGRLEEAGSGRYRRNFTVDWLAFNDAGRGDFRLSRSARVIGSARPEPDLPPPTREYVHPHSTRALDVPVTQPGAFQTLPR